MNETVEIDLREVGRTMLKRAWLIVLCAVVLGAAMLAYTVKCVTPLYSADVTMYVNNNNKSDDDSVSSVNLAVALRLVNSYVEIITSDAVLDQVAEELKLDYTASQLRGMVDARVVDETEIFTVTVTSPDPQMSADIANTIAQVAPPTVRDIVSGSFAKVIDYARVPTSRSSPSYVTNALLGAIAGAILAMVTIFICMQFDVHIKNEETLEKICGVPVLGVIPDFVEMAKANGKKARR